MSYKTMKKVALIIGNGFDLDLGLKTAYSHFATTGVPEWEKWLSVELYKPKSIYNEKIIGNSLGLYLKLAREKENWFDVEELIYNYVNENRSPRDSLIGLVRNQYDNFKICFQEYLTRVAREDNVSKQSLAWNLFRKSVKTKDYSVISFNYTDCYALCQCERPHNRAFYQVHGTQDGEIVLGCRDYLEKKVNNKFQFMYKPEHVILQKDIIVQRMKEATEVIIFGHSLNKMDFYYFVDYFKSKENVANKNHLTIICKDAESENVIRRNIESCVGHSATIDNADVIHTALFYMNNQQELRVYNELIERINIG